MEVCSVFPFETLCVTFLWLDPHRFRSPLKDVMWWQLWKEWWGEEERKRDSNSEIYNHCDIGVAPNTGAVFVVLLTRKRIEKKKEMGGGRRGECERKIDSNCESAGVRRKRDSNPSNPPPYLQVFFLGTLGIVLSASCPHQDACIQGHS